MYPELCVVHSPQVGGMRSMMGMAEQLLAKARMRSSSLVPGTPLIGIQLPLLGDKQAGRPGSTPAATAIVSLLLQPAAMTPYLMRYLSSPVYAPVALLQVTVMSRVHGSGCRQTTLHAVHVYHLLAPTLVGASVVNPHLVGYCPCNIQGAAICTTATWQSVHACSGTHTVKGHCNGMSRQGRVLRTFTLWTNTINGKNTLQAPAKHTNLLPFSCTPPPQLKAGAVRGEGLSATLPPLQPSLAIEEPLLQRQSRRVLLRWLEACRPGIGPRVARKMLDDGRQDFSMGRTGQNWRRVGK